MTVSRRRVMPYGGLKLVFQSPDIFPRFNAYIFVAIHAERLDLFDGSRFVLAISSVCGGNVVDSAANSLKELRRVLTLGGLSICLFSGHFDNISKQLKTLSEV